jgi:hypothetical protein
LLYCVGITIFVKYQYNLIDLLVKAEIIPDDTSRYIENINVRYLYMSGPPTVRISYDFVE